MSMFVNDSVFSIKLEVTYVLMMEVSSQDMVAFRRLGKVWTGESDPCSLGACQSH